MGEELTQSQALTLLGGRIAFVKDISWDRMILVVDGNDYLIEVSRATWRGAT
jgi:hypothetical protein